jgi:CubicO group peptidase (beta-lactamase class C family)
MSVLEQNHPLGAVFSYCNAGYFVLTHLIAQLKATTWESALRTDLLQPLGAEHAGTLPEEALLESAAVGHYWDASSAAAVRTHQWGLFRSVGGCGLLHCTPTELLAFACMHQSGGVTVDGRRLLSEASVVAMQTHQIDVPDPTEGTGWGLGWALDDWEGSRVYRHDGDTGSQSSFLAVVPDHHLAIALCTNGGRATSDFWAALSSEIAALFGVTRPASPRPPVPAVHVDPSLVEGTYRRAGFDAVVAAAGDALELRVTARGALVGLVADHVLELVGYDGKSILLGRVRGEDAWRPAVFFELNGDRYLHAAGLAFRRVPT